ncbi:hypothetical protein LGQ02_06150 [Bacillus shivajii]|uniref:hypothetical protein n=1 Tax=Bacillus shivajii TaxID=1983719 RepID=UPI001CFA1227|nr:hypothetical protein [Bacillus shivajii]UCZ54341.1 hypothetical protein LGQ02_06150 [Bacillus shivajii]
MKQMLVAPAVTRRSSKQFEEVLLVADPPRVAVFSYVHSKIKRTCNEKIMISNIIRFIVQKT